MATPSIRMLGRRLGLVLSYILFGLAVSAAAAETARRFDLPADLAERALKTFALQSGQEVLFTTATAANVRTNAVRGEHTPREAITRMLAGTPLAAVQDEQSGAWRIRRSGISSDGAGASNQEGAGGRGSLSGRVSNAATRTFLEGAVVEIAEMNRRVLTDPSGQYTFANLPAGEYQVVTSYTGLDSLREAVSVAPGGRTQRDFELTSAIYALEAVTVTGEREGNAVSITRQRNADNVVNIVSMDTYGNVADGNIGNFMQRLPGIGAIIENGDIIGFGVRGTPSELNAVNVDGVRSSSAYGGFNPQGDRAAVVDAIPSEFIKEIELIKALTPDIAADSVGGATNLITKSALDFKSTVFTYRAGFNHNTFREDDRRWKPTGALSYMTRIGSRKNIGLAFSGSYTETENSRDRVQMARGQVDGRNTGARTLDDQSVRTRGGLGLKLNFRPLEDLDLFAGVQYTYFSFQLKRTDWNIQSSNVNVADYSVVSRAQIEAGVVPRTSTNAVAGVAPGFTDAYTELLNANFVNTAGGTARHGRTLKLDVGGTRTWAGDQKLSFQASYNPSVYDVEFQFIETRRNGRIGVAVDTRANRDRPLYVQTYGNSIGSGASLDGYTALRAMNDEYSEEEVGNIKVDYEKRFATNPYALQLKSGFNWRAQHRILEVFQPRWDYVGADGAAGSADDNLAQFRRAEPGYGLFNNQYPQRDQFDYPKFLTSFESNPTSFRARGTTVSAGPRFNEINEDVYAAYAMGRMKFGTLGVLAGVRVEQTDLSATGQITDPRNPGISLVTRDGSYREVFPSLHFRYEPLRGLLLRASATTGYARPSFGQLYPVTTVSYNETTGLGQVRQNDPALKPQFSDNYDFSAEYYFEPVGVLSASLFRKNISGFIASETVIIGNGPNNGYGGDYEDFDLITTRNFGSATIKGYELNYSQQLRRLPKPFNSLSVFANYTRIQTEGTYNSGNAELVRFIPETANVGASWRWAKLELRAAYNFKSGYLNTYNVNPWARQRVTGVETWDFNAQYRFSPRFTMFVDVVNAFNKWASWYTGTDPGRVIMSEVYGTRLSVGVSGRF